MTRHSKNPNARAFYSNTERSKLGWGSSSERLGVDSQLPFGYCCLSLQPAKFPMASPQGWIFDRNVVVEYLANEREGLKAKLANWEADQKRIAAESDVNRIKSKQLQKSWQQSESGLGCVVSKSDPSASKKRGIDEVSKSDARAGSFWVAPAAVAGQVGLSTKPDTTPRCPMSGEKLRFKDLIPVNFEMALPSESDKGMFSCALTKRPITHQQAVLIKPSGIVVLESAFQQSVKPDDLRCPVTGAQLEPSDIIKLKTGGTSFSAHSKVEVRLHK